MNHPAIVYEAPEPHKCVVYPPFPLADKPLGSIARCDCGRYFVSRTDSEYGGPTWKPVRWYHREAKRRIAELGGEA